MPLPLYDPPTMQSNPMYSGIISYIPIIPQKKIISHYTHKKLEDRISQRTWYNNVTYPDEVARSLVKARNMAASAAATSSLYSRKQ